MSNEAALHIRSATPADLPPILALHRRSLRELGQGHYDEATVEAAIQSGTLPPELLRFGRYRVAVKGGRMVGSGGWVDGGPLPRAIGDAQAAGRSGTAIIRAVYVDPDLVRQGIGRAVLDAVEADAVAAGKDRAELLASRMAVRFFSRHGYRMGGPLALATADDRLIDVFAMAKTLGTAPVLQRPARRPLAARPFPGFAAAA